MAHLTFDHENDRAKVFKFDFTFRVPARTGWIYEFKNKRMLHYNRWTRTCEEFPLVGNTFFKDLAELWMQGAQFNEYLGPI